MLYIYMLHTVIHSFSCVSRFTFRQLAKDAKRASLAISFILSLIMTTLLCSRMWKSNPLPNESSFDEQSTYMTAAGESNLFDKKIFVVCSKSFD